jgi:hypothetical protein
VEHKSYESYDVVPWLATSFVPSQSYILMFNAWHVGAAVVICLAALCSAFVAIGNLTAAQAACIRVRSDDQLEAILRFTFAYDSPAAICIEVDSNNRCSTPV